MIHIYTYTPPIKDFKKFLFWTSFQNFFRSSICKNTQFNAIESFFLPPPPSSPRIHSTCTSCSATPILIFYYDGSSSLGSESRAAYAQWKVGRGKRSPPAEVVISSVIFAHGTGRSSPRFRRFPPNNGPNIALICHQGDGFVSSRLLLTDFFLNG